MPVFTRGEFVSDLVTPIGVRPDRFVRILSTRKILGTETTDPHSLTDGIVLRGVVVVAERFTPIDKLVEDKYTFIRHDLIGRPKKTTVSVITTSHGTHISGENK